jgi:hypothetical protein
MESDRFESSRIWAARVGSGSPVKQRERADVNTRVLVGVDTSDRAARPERAPKVKRLIADQRCFGVDALAFREGAERVLARIAAQEELGVDIRGLSKDFALDAIASWKLVRALLAAGLLQPDGTGRYCPTARFRDYANASVVAPLSRARAKRLIDRAIALATRINTSWKQNPCQIHEMAVAGSYMSRSDPLPELSLWLVLQERGETRALRTKRSPQDDRAAHQIVSAMRALSSFMVVRVAHERQDVQRPFILVFEADDQTAPRSAPAAWDKVLEWGASIGRHLVPR